MHKAIGNKENCNHVTGLETLGLQASESTGDGSRIVVKTKRIGIILVDSTQFPGCGIGVSLRM